jgi:hypothetical protein
MEESQDLTPAEARRQEEIRQLDRSEEESVASPEQLARVSHSAARPKEQPAEKPSVADAPRKSGPEPARSALPGLFDSRTAGGGVPSAPERSNELAAKDQRDD